MLEKLFCLLGTILILALLAYGITLISPELTNITANLQPLSPGTMDIIKNITGLK